VQAKKTITSNRRIYIAHYSHSQSLRPVSQAFRYSFEDYNIWNRSWFCGFVFVHLAIWSWKKQQSFIMYLLFVLNNFMRKRNTAKSKERISDCHKGQTSVAYRRIGMHLLSTKWSTTSSEASRPTFPKTVFIER